MLNFTQNYMENEFAVLKNFFLTQINSRNECSTCALFYQWILRNEGEKEIVLKVSEWMTCNSMHAQVKERMRY